MTGVEREAVRGGGDRRAQWFKGLADLALLRLLRDEPHYGLQILDRLRSEAGLGLAEGSIYPLLHRLERAGLVSSEWRLAEEGGRPRRYYAITDAGAEELGELLAEWRRLRTELGDFLERP